MVLNFEFCLQDFNRNSSLEFASLERRQNFSFSPKRLLGVGDDVFSSNLYAETYLLIKLYYFAIWCNWKEKKNINHRLDCTYTRVRRYIQPECYVNYIQNKVHKLKQCKEENKKVASNNSDSKLKLLNSMQTKPNIQ